MFYKKGFTLAELLIVVATIAVLVGISIPVFTSQLEKSRDAVSLANLRSAYAEASATHLSGEDTGNAKIVGDFVVVSNVELKGKISDNFSGNVDSLPFIILGDENDIEPEYGTYEVYFDFNNIMQFEGFDEGDKLLAYLYKK